MFKHKINKICFDKQLFLTEIYNFIFIYVSLYILIIALYFRYLNLFISLYLIFSASP